MEGSISHTDSYDVYVAKDYFKFNAAHFIAYEGFREFLHGHNYTVSVRLRGNRCSDGYVVDFGHVKKLVRTLCKSINERIILPEKSNVLKISTKEKQVEVICEDDSFFSFPRKDCAILPLVHSSAEELAEYLLSELYIDFKKEFGDDYLDQRGISEIEVSVSEAPNQTATCSRNFSKQLNGVKH
eukprot:snap_masked-scaffold_2-processed-gene-4.4-mRNA-1 protein AED:0.05 eAED:0.06 QI:0/-1/0/1/-1/1/1/0/183